MSVVNAKLHMAGIPIEVNPSDSSLTSLVPLYAIFANRANRVAEYGDCEDRISALIKAGGGPVGIPALISTMSRVSSDLTPKELICRAMESRKSHIAMGRVLRLEALRSTFMQCALNDNNEICYEGCFGLIGIGINEDEARRLLSAYQGSSDKDNKHAYLAAVVRSTHFMTLIKEGLLEDEVDSSPLLISLISVFEEESLTPLIDHIQTCGENWLPRICLYFILGHLAKTFATIDDFESMLELFANESDGDAATMAMYALGQFVQVLGIDASIRVLEKARDDLKDGSQPQSLIINAAYRARLNADERATMLEVIETFSSEDGDLKRALGRAKDQWGARVARANHWFFQGGYGRGCDLFDPFAPEPGAYVPAEIKALLFTPTLESLNLWVTMIKEMGIKKEFVALGTARIMEIMPHIAPLFAQLLMDGIDNNNVRSGVAVALLGCDAELAISPLHLRCLMGENDRGGPPPETLESVGVLLGYAMHSQTQEVARKLLMRVSEENRKVCIGFLKSYAQMSNDTDYLKLMFELGGSVRSTPKVEASVENKLAFGQLVNFEDLNSYLQQGSNTSSEHVWSLILNALELYDRSEALILARQHTLWANAPLPLLQDFIFTLGRSDEWRKKELSCVLLGALKEQVLEGSLRSYAEAHINRLVNDGDSDVRREAKRAAGILKIKALIINPNTIAGGILKGNQDPEQPQWIDRLFEFLKTENERSGKLELCRNQGIWSHIDPARLSSEWNSLSHQGWVEREAMCVLASHYLDLLSLPDAESIRERLVALCADHDSDVKREAKRACQAHGFEYEDDDSDDSDDDIDDLGLEDLFG